MQLEKLFRQSILWRGFSFLSILVLNIVVSRYLAAELSGWVYYYTNIFSLLVLVGSFNVESGFTYFSANKTITYNSLAWFGLCIVGVVACITAVISYYYFSANSSSVFNAKNEYLFAVYYVCGILLANFYHVLFYAQKNFVTPNICMGCSNFLLVAILLFLFKQQSSVAYIVQTYFFFFLVQGVVVMVFFFLQNGTLFQVKLPSISLLKKLYKYSLVTFLANLIFYFVYRLDYFFVQHYCTANALGNYVQASKMGQILLILPQILASVVFPETSGEVFKQKILPILFILFRVMSVVFLTGLVPAIFGGDIFFKTLFGFTFTTANQAFVVLIPGILALAILVLLSAYFSGNNKAINNTKGAIIALAIIIIGNIIFIPKYGIVAAAAVSSIAYMANCLYALQQLKKEYHFAIKDIFWVNKNDFQWLLTKIIRKK